MNGVDAVQGGLDGVNAFSIDAFFVHAGGIIVADLLIDGRAARRRLPGLLQDLALDPQVLLAEFIEAVPLRLVGREGVLRAPVAARVLIEVRARADVGVHGPEIETGLAGLWYVRGSLGERGEGNERACGKESGKHA